MSFQAAVSAVLKIDIQTSWTCALSVFLCQDCHLNRRAVFSASRRFFTTMSESSTASQPEASSFVPPSFMSNFGIEHRVYTGQLLVGKMKERCSDFVVTEIDCEGQLAVLDDSSSATILSAAQKESPRASFSPSKLSLSLSTQSQISPSQPSPSQTSQSQISPSQPSPSQSQISQSRISPSQPSPSQSSPSQPSLPVDLHELISTELYCQLEDFSANFEQREKNLCLGVHEDKETRMVLHEAVRRTFPNIETYTARDAAGHAQIFAKVHSAFQPLCQLLGAVEARNLLLFIYTADRTKQAVYKLPSDSDKQHRTKVHRIIYELFGRSVQTRSMPAAGQTSRRKKSRLAEGLEKEDEEKSEEGCQIMVTLKNRSFQAQQETTWTKFVMQKENMDTFEALRQLTSVLRCHSMSSFTFAGLKDKYAITTQFMTVKNASPDRIAACVNSPSLDRIKIGNWVSVPCPLMRGDLSGNHFKLVVRQLKPSTDSTVTETVEAAMHSLKENGFINYFGVQRFGGEAGNGPLIGLAMLQLDYMRAVSLLLQPREVYSDSPAQKAKRYFTETHDIEGTLKRMPSSSRETILLRVLQCHGYSEIGCQKALKYLPQFAKMLYVNSFISLVWNHIASYRISQYGYQPVVGDIVINSASERKEMKMLSSEDIDSGKYTLQDIVLPVPGPKTMYPQNSTGDRLNSILDETGISLSSIATLCKTLQIAYTNGHYRKLLVKPNDLSWQLLADEDADSTLKLEFSLPSSCYATVMMKEFLDNV